jgi:hypothetical protein
MQTPLQNEAGVSQSQLVRYQQGMIQKVGGWSAYNTAVAGSTVRDLWGWQGLTGTQHLAIGATQSLSVVTSNNNQVITPQTRTSNPTPSFSTTLGSTVVTIVDANSSANSLTTIYLNTPIAIAGQILNGPYQVTSPLGSSDYQINLTSPATATVSSGGQLPLFTVSSNSAQVWVDLPNYNFPNILGLYQQFIATTTLGASAGSSVPVLTIQGPYQTTISASSPTNFFSINTQNQSAVAVSSSPMNGGNAQIVYYYTGAAPFVLGFGQGASGFGAQGSYGVGGTAAAATGNPITATDWSLCNWGETLLAVPSNGPLYQWSANSGYTTASVVETAPFFNGGCFVSQPQQILVLWRSVQSTGVQDPLVVRWSDALDYTNYNVTSQTWAGSFHIPTGSIIKGGLQVAQQGIIWTDIECWVMQNVGQPLVFGFNKVGSGCGLVGQHACGTINGITYWMGPENFFVLGPNGVDVVPSTVWNFVFDQIDRVNIWKVRCAVNSLFNEVSWFFPQIGGGGENTLYVKYNLKEQEWDYGSLGRSAWIDVTVLGNPIAADLLGNIWQHDMGYNAGTVAMDNSFRSGWWSIADGDQVSVVDWILPDMTFTTYGGATSSTITITFLSCFYVGGPIATYGPFTFNSATQYINTRIRGRFLAIQIENNTLNDYWRVGRIHYRFAADGRQ